MHYAACFGRPQIAKILLKFGANPELRDEEGKTPLDKARERNDEGHREVAVILQSPAEWLADVELNVRIFKFFIFMKCFIILLLYCIIYYILYLIC